MTATVRATQRLGFNTRVSWSDDTGPEPDQQQHQRDRIGQQHHAKCRNAP